MVILTRKPKQVRRSLIIKVIVVILLIVFAVPFFIHYFNESFFYVNQYKYKEVDVQDHLLHYGNSTGPSLDVHLNDACRSIVINNGNYSVCKKETALATFEVTYPNGTRYEVQDHNGNLMAFDESGKWVGNFTIFGSNGNRIMEPGEELYLPSTLVAVAYGEYHSKQGKPVLFFLSIIVLIYGWSSFRYESFQTFQFKISPTRLYVQDWEPSDFYYFMCKVGGIVLIVIGIVLFFMSLVN